MYSDQYIFLVLSSFFVSVVGFSLFINAILLKFATTLGIRQREGAVIRWSSVSKPALGGLSFYMAFLLSTACYSIFFDGNWVFQNNQALGLLGTTALAFMMGLADDAYDTKPMLKFFIQFVCGGILIFSNNYIKLFDAHYLNYLVTIIWVIGIMNSINMLDNMDGITTSVSLSIITICIISASFHGHFSNFEYLSMIGMLAALTGFLFFNWHPSKMFMGDSGSQFLGMFLAFISVKYLWNGSLLDGKITFWQQVSQVLVAFVIPLTDTTTVFINRIARKQSPFVGGKDHTTHHLSYLGLSDSQVGFIFIGINVLAIIISIGIYRFVDVWRVYHTLGSFAFVLTVFGVLFYISQLNKNKRR